MSEALLLRRQLGLVHENGRYWVRGSARFYLVMVAGSTHSESESAYPRNDDGLSIAIARCDYLARARP